MEMPSWVARLPNKVGLPAGGNLTSDEWKGMLLVFCPLIASYLRRFKSRSSIRSYLTYGPSGTPSPFRITKKQKSLGKKRRRRG